MLARTPTEAYRECHPEIALPSGDRRHVDLNSLRGSATPLDEQFAFAITAENGTGRYVRGLITGHRGCGKTSELLRLSQQLEEEAFFVVYFDVEGLIGLADVEVVDILILIAQQVVAAVNEKDAELPESLLVALNDYFVERSIVTVEQVESKIGISAEASAGGAVAGLLKLLGKLTADVKGVSDRRVETRKSLNLDFAGFASRLNLLLAEATIAMAELAYQGMVVIVDGLEKLNLIAGSEGISNFEQIFVHGASQLNVPECHVIYTVPMALAYNQNLGNGFVDGVYVMPMLNMTKPHAADQVAEVVRRRVSVEDAFEEAADLAKIVASSGGCLRDLLRLVRMACGPGEKIRSTKIDRAIITLQQEYDRLYFETDLPTLFQVSNTRTLDAVDSGSALLHKRVILEYQNDSRWVDIHPAISKSASFRERMNRYVASIGTASA
jgi:hypothetical protein